MRKLFLALLAVATLMSCEKEIEKVDTCETIVSVTQAGKDRFCWDEGIWGWFDIDGHSFTHKGKANIVVRKSNGNTKEYLGVDYWRNSEVPKTGIMVLVINQEPYFFEPNTQYANQLQDLVGEQFCK